MSAYRIESDGGLRFLNQRPTGGADPCYVGLDRERRCLTVANFTGGSVCSYPLCADGSLGKKGVIIRHYGHGADPVRQSAPAPSCGGLGSGWKICYCSRPWDGRSDGLSGGPGKPRPLCGCGS